MQATTVTHVRHLNEQGYNFSIKTTGISSHACCPLEKKGVWLLSVSFFVERRPLLSLTREGVVLSTRSVSNETDLMTNIWFKLNQRAKYLR